MFHNLGKRIVLALSITLSIFVVITSIVLYSVISHNIFGSYEKTAIQYIQQKVQNFHINMRLAEEVSKLLLNNSKILEAMDKSMPPSEVESILDGIKSTDSDFSIVGIYLYSNKGMSYSSSNVSNMPTYEQLKKDMDLDYFLNSSQQSLWVVRNSNINENINIRQSDPYKTNYGLLTFTSKVFDNDHNYRGILVVNIDIMKLYNLFKSQKDGFFSPASSYILKEDEILPYPYISKKISPYLEKELINKKSTTAPFIYKNNLILNSELSENSNTYIVTVMPLSPFYDKFKALILILLVTAFLFIPCFIIVSRLVSISITSPLSKLYSKMEKVIQK